MTRKNYILTFLSVGLSIFFVRGQQIANYVSNGSFEDLYTCTTQPLSTSLKYWGCIDSTVNSEVMHTCWGNLPYSGAGYQYPKHGNAYTRLTLWCPFCVPNTWDRSNLRNRLKQTLTAGKTYCVKMWVTTQDICPVAIDGFGFYFGGPSIDTIIYNSKRPLTFLTPQVVNPPNNIIMDSLNWVPITGTFTANGTEKYLIIGNFKSDANTNTVVTNYMSYEDWSEYFVDAVSCIPLDLPAYAGPDAFCIPGNSVYIGRQQDVGIDEACMWYKLPNMTSAIDTAAGIWVSPPSTSTYIVKQEICGNTKYDTVVIYQSAVGFKDLQMYSDNINLFPNPTLDNLNILYIQGVSEVSISNSLGQIIRQEDLNPNNNQIILQTSDLSNGLYQIHLKTSFGTVIKKFVKTN